MYIEFLQGQKFATKGADKADTPDAFTDCGYVINENEVIIDIDHLPKESIRKLIKTFHLNTQVVWTDRGAHLYFMKPTNFKRAKNGVCRLAFEIEQHTSNTRPNGITIKRNGVLREIENEGKRMYLPDIFEVATKKNNYQNLLGLNDSEGRNTGLFTHRVALGGCDQWQQILEFINDAVFASPLDEGEMKGLLREDIGEKEEKSDAGAVCSLIKNQCSPVLYRGNIWWFKDGEYFCDTKMNYMRRKIYSLDEDKSTSYVDEIVRRIQYQAEIIDDEAVFPIRLRNGIIYRGQFIETYDYREFTPYYIDIEYKEDAEPIKFVDDYIDNLTGGDESYRKLLMEVLGYAFITEAEKIRSLGKFFIFRGDGGNGKGTLLQIMKCILGKQNCSSMSIKELTDERYKVTLAGKLANLGDDMEPATITDEQLKVLKNISTCDTVSGRQLYEQAENKTYTAKLYFTSNYDIKSFEKGYAYRRRIVWLPMFTQVKKPDPKFISKATSQEALEYWMRLIVDGYKRLYDANEWSECRPVEKYNDQYHENNNSMMMFAKELDLDAEILGKTITQISKVYEEWDTESVKFSKKLFKQAVWDLYKAGVGVCKVNGKSLRIFMLQEQTTQSIAP